MFNSVVLDVFIGLVFIFLLYSLLATIVQEMLARALGLRSRMLMKAVRVMLQDRSFDFAEKKNALYRFWLRMLGNLKGIVNRLFYPLKGQPFAEAFFAHPTIKYLARSAYHSKPSYIGPDNFSNTIIRLLRGADFGLADSQMEMIRRTLFEKKSVVDARGNVSKIDEETLQHLQQLFIEAHNDVSRFKVLLEEWFDHTMERANGWYKKQTQNILLVVGFVFAFAFNIDAIAIYRILSTDKKVRDEMVQMAIANKDKYGRILDSVKVVTYTKTSSIKNDTTLRTVTIDSVAILATDAYLKNTYNELVNDAEKANNILGLGKPYRDTIIFIKTKRKIYTQSKQSDSAAVYDKLLKDFRKNHKKWFKYSPRQNGGWETFFGWVITALAISLGAPFWFDLLSKLISMRSTGAKSAGKDEEKKNTAATPLISPKDIKG